MSRRRQSFFEDLIDLAALLPPWLSTILAILAYFILHQYVVSDVVVSTESPASLLVGAKPMIYRSFATFGQYVTPMILLFGAVISFFKRRRRQALVSQTQAHGKVSGLLNMGWQEFEQLVGEAFKRRGYAIRENAGKGPDGGVDLVLSKNNEVFLVQCKQWRAQKVGVGIVRELYGVMAAKGATGGFIVASGTFTNDALAFADGRNIELIAGEKLLAFIMAGKSAKEPLTGAKIQPVSTINPSCPDCGNSMVSRVASRGTNAGNAFWGCPSFPRCRGTLPVI